ncbi:MAG: glycosyl hydrolase family protein [Spirochaetaceae bacterium]|nr:MAG: glycosyl hydrolase family protein [Spirochaetaceae bacterium]
MKPQPTVTVKSIAFSALLLMFLLLLAALAACHNDVLQGDADPAAGGGTLRVSLGHTAALSLLPDISLDPVAYRLHGNGPAGQSFDLQTSRALVVVEGLAAGTWAVTVDAFNGSGDHIGRGIGNAAVEAGMAGSLPITVRPLPGPGTLELTAEWPAGALAAAALDARLIGYGGSQLTLPFELGSHGAEFSSHDIGAGYYTLALQLRDGESVVAGAVETVRIAEGARTAGRFVFSELNVPAAEVEIVITPELDEPLLVSISGSRDSIAAGETMQLEARVGNAAGRELFFAWYLNGNSLGGGPTVALGADLAAGSYRLDLVAYSSDGLRSGSASHLFSVLPAAADPAPDPGPDPGPEPVYDFIDTFEGSTVDSAKWRIGTWREHGGQLSADRVYVEDGKLVMVFEYDSDYYDQTGLFKSSAIQTRRDDFGYGRWEARLKPTDIDGVLPTMYTIDWREPGVRTRQEIDIEFVTVNIGDDYSEVHFAVHGADFSSWATQVELPFNPAADFHVWGFDISPQRIQWFVEDIVLYEYWYDQQPGWIDAPYMLKFNFWSTKFEDGGSGWWIKGPPVANTEIYYYIDWVRFTPYSP